MTKSDRRNVSKQGWLIVALETLELGGIESLRIERLAARLNVSRSGFYWHFKDRNELLIGLLNYWTEEYTNVVIKELSKFKMDPVSRLDNLMEIIWKHNLAKYDLAIRTWALTDSLAKKAVKKVNKIRLDYLRSIFSELGFVGDELEMRTMLFVAYQTWENPMFGKLPSQKWKKLKKLRLELLLQKISND